MGYLGYKLRNNFSMLDIDELIFINGGSGSLPSSSEPKVTVIKCSDGSTITVYDYGEGNEVNVGDSGKWGDDENTITVDGDNNQININSSGNSSGPSSKQ
ncbi:MAG: hypothetical protein HUJ68_10135 [Clostridia bacterium]|nr:hypothetical protein [Clostridia bacterium]